MDHIGITMRSRELQCIPCGEVVKYTMSTEEIISKYGSSKVTVQEVIDMRRAGKTYNSIKKKFNLTSEEVNAFRIILTKQWLGNIEKKRNPGQLKAVKYSKKKCKSCGCVFEPASSNQQSCTKCKPKKY